MRMRKKPNLAARVERCAHFLVSNPHRLKGRWSTEFSYDELHIELGCGKGRFAIETAKASENIFVVALEKSINVAVAALELAHAQSLKNVRIINSLADKLCDFFAQGEASMIYINFCDPWPLDRHAKRRLTHRRFLDIYKQVLCIGGEIHIKTDNAKLFEFSLSEFDSCGFDLLESDFNLHKDGIKGVMTDYESKYHSQGLPILSAKFVFGH